MEGMDKATNNTADYRWVVDDMGCGVLAHMCFGMADWMSHLVFHMVNSGNMMNGRNMFNMNLMTDNSWSRVNYSNRCSHSDRCSLSYSNRGSDTVSMKTMETMETISMETISSVSYSNRGSHGDISSLSNSDGGSSSKTKTISMETISMKSMKTKTMTITSNDSGISITLLTSLLSSSNDGETMITKAMMAETVSSQTGESVASVSRVGGHAMVDWQSCGKSSVAEVAKAKAVTKTSVPVTKTSVPVKGVGFRGSQGGANKSKNSKELHIV